MKLLLSCALAAMFSTTLMGQTNTYLSNPDMMDVLSGNYNPSDYAATVVIDDRSAIVSGITSEVSPDSLNTILDNLVGFGTRHTFTDTVSNTRGMGAARRWVVSQFERISNDNENRLLTGYLDFDYDPTTVCDSLGGAPHHHRNPVAILPGTNLNTPDFLLIEAHLDSRCTDPCDTTCDAPGREDDGSGVAMLLELARVMSKYSYDRTIVFTATTGEELGLIGATAWANYINSNSWDFGVCLNNDMAGGILCGPVSSPPGCSPAGSIDSTSIRVFSLSSLNNPFINSPHKQLARYIKLQQIEEINPTADVPMEIRVMLQHDRQGRNGDHSPFHGLGYRAVRFTSTNEHGDGSGGLGHMQHTSFDTLVDNNYLARNVRSNGVNLGLLALAPPAPTPNIYVETGGIRFEMTGPDAQYMKYRVGVRDHDASDLYWDDVYTFTGDTVIHMLGFPDGDKYYFSVMNVDDDDIESLPSDEYTVTINSVFEPAAQYGITLSQNYPNPFGESTIIEVDLDRQVQGDLRLVYRDVLGRIIDSRVLADFGNQRIEFQHPGNVSGILSYAVVLDGQILSSRKMIAK